MPPYRYSHTMFNGSSDLTKQEMTYLPLTVLIVPSTASTSHTAKYFLLVWAIHEAEEPCS